MATGKTLSAKFALVPPLSPSPSRHIRFSAVDIVDLQPDIAMQSVPCTGGPPVGLSSVVANRSRRRIDSFERDRQLGIGAHGSPKVMRRQQKSFLCEGHLPRETRIAMLRSHCRVEDMLRAESQTMQTQRERLENNRMDEDSGWSQRGPETLTEALSDDDIMADHAADCENLSLNDLFA